MSLFLAACDMNEVVEVMPIETVACTHPASLYEGSVVVEVEDEVPWGLVEFYIFQGDNQWGSALQTSDGYLWEARMQLYELDCRSEFEYLIVYSD